MISQTVEQKLFFMSLILRVGWVWTLEKYVTKFYVTNWEGRVSLNPNMYNVTLFGLFFFEGFPKGILSILISNTVSAQHLTTSGT